MKSKCTCGGKGTCDHCEAMAKGKAASRKAASGSKKEQFLARMKSYAARKR